MKREAAGDSFWVLVWWNRFKVGVVVACVASGGTVLLPLFLILEPLVSRDHPHLEMSHQNLK